MKRRALAVAIAAVAIALPRVAAAQEGAPHEPERWKLGFDSTAITGVTVMRSLPRMTIEGAKLGTYRYPVHESAVVMWDFLEGRLTAGPSNGLYIPLLGFRASLFSMRREMAWLDGASFDGGGTGLDLLFDGPGVGARMTSPQTAMGLALIPSLGILTYGGTLARNADSAQETTTARAIYFTVRADAQACLGGSNFIGFCAYAAPALAQAGTGGPQLFPAVSGGIRTTWY
jgi:hypothetical protein